MPSVHNKWYYVKQPVYPEKDSSGNHFKIRAIYSVIVKLVKDNPGLTGREIAEKMGRKERSVTPFLWALRKYTGALEFEQVGYHRNPELNEFQKLPSVQKMILKASSKNTWDPWVRRCFRYEKWLKEGKKFRSIESLLSDYKKATSQDRRYYHIDLISDYVNSFKADKTTKESVVKAIRAFYAKNRAELPREKITYKRDMLANIPSGADEYVKPDEIWRMVQDGNTTVRDKAALACLLCLGLDESTFANHFNYYGYPQVVSQLGENPKHWDLEKAPIRINLVRSKTQTKYYNYLPAKALELLVAWIIARPHYFPKPIHIHNEDGMQKSDPLFLTNAGNPLDEHNINKIVRETSFRSGVQQYVKGTKIYRIHAHEFRDTFRTTCKIAGVDSAVSEFFIGHSIDNLGYDKSPWAYPEHFKGQYRLLEPYLTGEASRMIVSENQKKEVEDLFVSVQSRLDEMVAQKVQQILSQRQKTA